MTAGIELHLAAGPAFIPPGRGAAAAGTAGG